MPCDGVAVLNRVSLKREVIQKLLQSDDALMAMRNWLVKQGIEVGAATSEYGRILIQISGTAAFTAQTRARFRQGYISINSNGSIEGTPSEDLLQRFGAFVEQLSGFMTQEAVRKAVAKRFMVESSTRTQDGRVVMKVQI